MIIRISIAAAALMLATPTLAQDVWAPWAGRDAAPVEQVAVVRTTVPVQRVAQQTPRAETPAPTRMFRFDRLWVVGSFR